MRNFSSLLFYFPLEENAIGTLYGKKDKRSSTFSFPSSLSLCFFRLRKCGSFFHEDIPLFFFLNFYFRGKQKGVEKVRESENITNLFKNGRLIMVEGIVHSTCLKLWGHGPLDVGLSLCSG